MTKSINKYFSFLLLLSFFIIPAFSFAEEVPFKLDYSGLVKCDGVIDKNEPERQKVCDFNALISMVKSTINWLFVLTTSIAVLSCAYGGLMYMTGVEKNINKAKSLFYSIGKGFIIMLVAWFAVITVVNWFATTETQKIIKTFVDTGK